MQNETVLLSPGQMKEMAATVIECLPSDIPEDIAQGWIKNRKALTKELRELLIPPLAEVSIKQPPQQSNLIVNLRELIANPDPQPESFTEENLTRWAQYNLKPVFFPELELSEKLQMEDYIKPRSWFYQSVRSRAVKPVGNLAPTALKRGWYLADHTIGTDYDNGKQVFQNDPLTPLIERLRREKKLGKNDITPLGSRFTITHDEWANVLLPALATELGLEPKQVRLERAIEFNFIGNLYDTNRGKFNTWEWFADRFEGGGRLVGGHHARGGLTSVGYYDWRDYRGGSVAGRPLVSFVS